MLARCEKKYVQPRLARPANDTMMSKRVQTRQACQRERRSWRQIVTLAGLAVLGLTPWAQAQQPLPDFPAVCPPLTAFATPTMFDVMFGTVPIRFPF